MGPSADRVEPLVRLDLGPWTAAIRAAPNVLTSLNRFTEAPPRRDRPELQVRILDPTTESEPAQAPELPCRPIAGSPTLLSVTTPFFRGTIDLATRHVELVPGNPDVMPSGLDRRIYGMLRLVACVLATEARGLAFHAAATTHGDCAVVFLGRRRRGKTTLTRRFATGTVLGDDLAVVLPDGDGYRVHGTPFSGREQTASSLESAPLSRICVLSQGERTAATRLGRREAAAELWRHAFVHVDSAQTRLAAMETVLRLASEVPVFALSVHLSQSPFSLEELQ